MKKIKILLVCISIMLITGACEKEYSGKFVPWGDIRTGLSIDKLKKNNIPYNVEENTILIPEDAFDDAIYCCS
jgi:flagellar biosynthesis/type III secretory pathway M-ring protein FliF/YscJ